MLRPGPPGMLVRKITDSSPLGCYHVRKYPAIQFALNEAAQAMPALQTQQSALLEDVDLQ
jgi:hypothetical protein